jgi:polysaccharide deacetylase 2 family uncharacterized protein YibQ
VPPAETGPPAWRRRAVAASPAASRPTLAIVIEDMGANPALSARAVALPAPLTLAWLPQAPQLAGQLAAATARGHEAMLEMPMETPGQPEPGPDTLRTWLPPATNLLRFRAALDVVPDAVGMIPQEGGIAELSVPLMDLVMGELAARRLTFVDNPTLPHGVALARADAAGLPAAAHDAVLDADPNPAAIRARLAEAEAAARRAGHAIVLGHARPATLDVLQQYLPSAPARGFVLWPVSATLAAAMPMADSAAAELSPPPPTRTTASASEVAIAPAPRSGAE